MAPLTEPMSLTLQQLEAIQADAMADDIAIDVAKMSLWTEAQAREFFESGGEVEPAAQEAPPRRLRVLALHAFRTNGRILEQQQRLSLQAETLRDVIDFEVLDAPHVCSAEEAARAYPIVHKIFPASKYGSYREWYNAVDVEATKEAEWSAPTARYAHFDEAIAAVTDALARASPPFDGLLGFSQGGSLALQVVAMQRAGTLLRPCPPVRFVWIQSSRLPRDPACGGLFSPPLRTPALVTYHDDDTSVRPEETRHLIEHLISPTVLHRPKGGHSLFSCREEAGASAVRAFFHERRRELASNASCA